MLRKLLLSLAVTLGLVATVAHARELPTGPEFCAVPPAELLVALDGNWKIKQGPGMAFGAMAGMPLPAHPAQKMKIQYDAASGTTRMKTPDSPDNMIMFPVAEAQQLQAAGQITQGVIEAAQQSAAACDWNLLPIIVGTNFYALDREESSPDFDSPASDNFYCSLPLDKIGLPPGAMEKVAKVMMKICYDDDGVAAAHGQMAMTLLVRFDSINSGRGNLFFEGEMQGYKFAAFAPVTLSR